MYTKLTRAQVRDIEIKKLVGYLERTGNIPPRYGSGEGTGDQANDLAEQAIRSFLNLQSQDP